jgi:hypothetical protein
LLQVRLKMNAIFNILREINEITLKIEFKYPELYKTLDEMPVKLQRSGDEIEPHALYDYLQALKAVLANYEKTHPILKT